MSLCLCLAGEHPAPLLSAVLGWLTLPVAGALARGGGVVSADGLKALVCQGAASVLVSSHRTFSEINVFIYRRL